MRIGVSSYAFSLNGYDLQQSWMKRPCQNNNDYYIAIDLTGRDTIADPLMELLKPAAGQLIFLVVKAALFRK